MPSPFPSAEQASRDRIQEEAALWFARLRGKRVSGAQRARFAAWLAADEAHRREYEMLEHIWAQSGQLAWPVKSAGGSGRKRAGRAAGLLGIALLGVWFGVHWFDGRISTAPGERRQVQLADGSRLDVAPRTSLRVRFDGAWRRLELDEGQIAITVAADAQRPFEVLAGGGGIRDLGTRFAVQASGRQVRVVVEEGVVEIRTPLSAATAPRQLVAGEAAEFDGAGIRSAQRVDAAASLAWTQGRLSFTAAPLPEVIAALNLYRRTPVEIDDSALVHVRISGVFLLDDEDSALRALQQVAPVRFESKAGRLWARSTKSFHF